MRITRVYSIILKGKIKIWVFSLLFISIGIIFAFLLPGIIAGTNDFRIMILIFKILGWIILIIGGTVFLLSIISVFIKINSPENEDTFFWWINFTGGMMGALFFAIPSTFIYLLFSVLPDDIKLQAQNTSILLPIFTLVGIAVDIAIFFIARYQLKDRPMWK